MILYCYDNDDFYLHLTIYISFALNFLFENYFNFYYINFIINDNINL